MATQQQKNASDLSEQAIALAEQLGRIAGTLEGTAEVWLNRPSLATQLIRVRDGAAQMLESLAEGAARSREHVWKKKKTGRTPAARALHADPAHAPGKRHRKPVSRKRGIRKSDESIPKLRTAHAVRQRRKSYA